MKAIALEIAKKEEEIAKANKAAQEQKVISQLITKVVAEVEKQIELKIYAESLIPQTVSIGIILQV
jgi:hypothetical protein